MTRIRRKIKPKSRIKTRVSGNYSSGTYSRRVNHEKKKVINQAVAMIIIAFLILLAFIFVIIPGFFKITSQFFDSSTPFQQSDNIAPQVPIISAPPTATSSANIKVSGFGEPKSDLVVVFNGAKKDSIKIEDDGSFETELTLDEGENIISAYSIDEAKNESLLTREYNTLLDTKAPELEIFEPEDGASFESRANQSITIKGKTDSDTKVYINNRVVFPNEDGEFEYIFRLQEGENPVEVRVQDKAKNSTKIDLNFNFKL